MTSSAGHSRRTAPIVLGATKDTARTTSTKPTRQMYQLSAAVIACRTSSLPGSAT